MVKIGAQFVWQPPAHLRWFGVTQAGCEYLIVHLTKCWQVVGGPVACRVEVVQTDTGRSGLLRSPPAAHVVRRCDGSDMLPPPVLLCRHRGS